MHINVGTTMYCRPDFPSCPGNPVPVAREFHFSGKTEREGKGREEPLR